MRIRFLTVFLILIFFSGCAAAHIREPYDYSQSISSSSYIALPSIVDNYNVNYQWDSIARKLTLSGKGGNVIVCVGSDIALVNGSVVKLNRPIQLQNGAIVFPESFVVTALKKVFSKDAAAVEMPTRIKNTLARVSSKYKVVIDPGHGGKDPGAVGLYGIKEKDITLDIANKLKAYLEAEGIRVVLTRQRDEFFSLWRRTNLANNSDAAFFVSIHANSFRKSAVNGFEVFLLSDAVDDTARAVAAAENSVLNYEKSSFPDKNRSTDLETILWDLEYSENRIESQELAEKVLTSVKSKLNVNNRGIKGANFYVLKGIRMPGILVEVGFLSNRNEAKKLKSPDYRFTLVKAIADGIVEYNKVFSETEGFTN